MIQLRESVPDGIPPRSVTLDDFIHTIRRIVILRKFFSIENPSFRPKLNNKKTKKTVEKLSIFQLHCHQTQHSSQSTNSPQKQFHSLVKNLAAFYLPPPSSKCTQQTNSRIVSKQRRISMCQPNTRLATRWLQPGDLINLMESDETHRLSTKRAKNKYWTRCSCCRCDSSNNGWISLTMIWDWKKYRRSSFKLMVTS